MRINELTDLHTRLTVFLLEHATERDAAHITALQQRLRRVMGQMRGTHREEPQGSRRNYVTDKETA